VPFISHVRQPSPTSYSTAGKFKEAKRSRLKRLLLIRSTYLHLQWSSPASEELKYEPNLISFH
jgi:hypothetical protein